jgi:hypothetical protein
MTESIFQWFTKIRFQEVFEKFVFFVLLILSRKLVEIMRIFYSAYSLMRSTMPLQPTWMY